MEYYNFEHIVGEFDKKQSDVKKDSKKLREQFTEILDLIGIDTNLLRKHKDESTGNMVSFDDANRQYCFPETICDFCVKMFMEYTSPDYKNLRRGQYDQVSLKQLNFLINGFTKYLEDLGYDFITVSSERFKMDRRLHYTTSLFLFQFHQECSNLLRDAQKYIANDGEGFYEDKTYFIWFMTEKVKTLRDYFASVYGNYTEVLFEEAEKLATDKPFEENNDDILYTMLLGDELKHDSDYQNLLQNQMEIMCEPDFLKKRNTSYHKNNEQLKAIKEKHERELFGNTIKNKECTYDVTLSHPLHILERAITESNDTQQMQIKNRESKIDMLNDRQKQDLKELFLRYFPLPDTSNLEQKITEKGIIKFPCCLKEETIVYSNAAGSIVCKCPRCSKQILFNFDDMTAEIYETPMGHMKL